MFAIMDSLSEFISGLLDGTAKDLSTPEDSGVGDVLWDFG